MYHNNHEILYHDISPMCILTPFLQIHSHVMLNCQDEAGKSLSYLYMMSDQAPEEALYVVLYIYFMTKRVC